MTALQLFGYISSALLFQLALGIGVGLWRRQGGAGSAPAAGPAQTVPAAAGAWSGWREFRVARREFEDADRSQCSFYLEPADGVRLPPCQAGQYLTFMLEPAAGATGAGRTVTRCYSLSDRPGPDAYRVTIKRMAPPPGHPEWPPGVGSTHFHDHVQVGDLLSVKPPSGRFCIDPDPQVPTVLIAGGIGITPMLSMLRWCLAEQPQRTVYLYYGLRHGGEHAFKPLLEQMAAACPNFHLNVVYSRARPEDLQGRDYQHAGRIDVDLLRRSLPHGRHRFYLCGPQAMMASLVPALAAWGVLPDDIHFEAFGPASMPALQPPRGAAGSEAPAGVEVQWLRSGRTLTWDGLDANLLDFAERHGVEVDSGCRAGSCGSCETRLVSGNVAYERQPDCEIAAGHCLLCVGTPRTALVLEA